MYVCVCIRSNESPAAGGVVQAGSVAPEAGPAVRSPPVQDSGASRNTLNDGPQY